MVAGNQVGQHPGQACGVRAVRLLKNTQGVQCASGGVGLVAALWQLALDVGVGGLPDVALKARTVFAQVMPQARQTGKIRTPVFGKP